MRDVLIAGAGGQLGIELGRIDWGEDVRLVQPSRAELDLTSIDSVTAFFERYSLAAVVNAAGYTAVDRAEAEVGQAFAANALGPALLAGATARAGIPIIQISTDYVFSGDKDGCYEEDDSTGPISVYGASKLAGELAIRSGNPRSVIVRTAWLLSPHRTNFLKTMLRLSTANPEIDVVADQIGCPTSATDLAEVIKTFVLTHLSDVAAPVGVYHFVNAGDVSWCDLANAIFELDAVGAPRARARPITTAEYPALARRPANSRLSSAKVERELGIVARPWRDAVADIIAELHQAENLEGAHQ